MNFKSIRTMKKTIKIFSIIICLITVASCSDNKELNEAADLASCDDLSEMSWSSNGRDVAKAAKLIKLNNEIFNKSDSYPTDCGEAKDFAIKHAGSTEYATLVPIGYPEMEKEFGGCWCKGFREEYGRD
jgi:hypothetical protein